MEAYDEFPGDRRHRDSFDPDSPYDFTPPMAPMSEPARTAFTIAAEAALAISRAAKEANKGEFPCPNKP